MEKIEPNISLAVVKIFSKGALSTLTQMKKKGLIHHFLTLFCTVTALVTAAHPLHRAQIPWQFRPLCHFKYLGAPLLWSLFEIIIVIPKNLRSRMYIHSFPMTSLPS